MSGLILFDDGRGQFGPLTDLRASFELRTGMFTTATRLANCFGELQGVMVPNALADLVAERSSVPVNRAIETGTSLFINGRLLLPQGIEKPHVGSAIIEADSGAIIAAHLAGADSESMVATGKLPDSVTCTELPLGTLAEFPWHILDTLPTSLLSDIDECRHPDPLMVPESQIMGTFPVKAHATAQIGAGVIIDARNGPVILWEHAEVGPNAVICGPASIGPHSSVQAQSLMRANTAIGPHCKVGGEVGGTIFQGYANKVHDGYLGDSLVGEWVNIGAGSNNSNLLNTYDNVTAVLQPGGPRHRTNRQFYGTIFGDHSKIAIGTRIMTAAVIGTGAMIATSAPISGVVGPFQWITDATQQIYRSQKFVKVAKSVMERRQVVMTAAYEAAIVHHLEAAQAGTAS
ncbi:MAG: putative sugar nucleotidyl transferase [Phycisphaerales bacterium]|nr:putative sugar nucleotidyl transferase [Phycisphaerales bacterium]